MKTLKFKFYQHQRNRYLKGMINAAGVIYNHCIALHKRYYRMWGKHLSCVKLQSHIAKLRKRNPFWQSVGSQAVQDICQRIEKAYQLFFKYNNKRKVRAEEASARNFARGGVKPPGFKKVKKYKSFTLKQAGYKFLGGNKVKIGNQVYQFWKSREIEGTVKTLTIKRTPLGELFMVVVVDDRDAINRVCTEYDYEEHVRGVYRPSMMETAARGDRTPTTSYDRNTYSYENEPNLYSTTEPNHQNLKLYEERLIANKSRVKTGEVAVGKHVETERVKAAVPIEREQVVIERTTPTDAGRVVAPGEANFRNQEVTRMDVYEETPDIRKEAVLREEVNVKKVVDRDTVEAQETLRREELDIDQNDPNIRETRR